MTRIIAGVAKGRRLQTPTGDATRPTTDRVREALFSSIESWAGSLQGLRFLDLFAGSGAVGLEAWSRGAASVRLVESDRRTAALIGANARALGSPVEVVASNAAAALARPAAGERIDVAFLDPPYSLGDEELAELLALLVPHLAENALVVVERSKRSPEPPWPDGVAAGRSKRYGETTLWYGHAP